MPVLSRTAAAHAAVCMTMMAARAGEPLHAAPVAVTELISPGEQ